MTMPLTELRRNIAENIHKCRLKNFPGRGGAKKCAEAFGVSQQQWSPWERGMRMPNEPRMLRIAQFFGVTVEYMRRDNSMHNRPPDCLENNFAQHRYRPVVPGAPSEHKTDVVWQCDKAFSGYTSCGEKVEVKLRMILTKDMLGKFGLTEPGPK